MALNYDEKFWKFVTGDDLDFYETFIMGLPDDQQEAFFNEAPDFMSEYKVWSGNIQMLKDKLYRGLLRKIKRYEERKAPN